MPTHMYTDEMLEQKYVYVPGGIMEPGRYHKVGSPKLANVGFTEHKDAEFETGMFSQIFGPTYKPKAMTLRTILGEEYLKDRVVSSPRDLKPGQKMATPDA